MGKSVESTMTIYFYLQLPPIVAIQGSIVETTYQNTTVIQTNQKQDGYGPGKQLIQNLCSKRALKEITSQTDSYLVSLPSKTHVF